MCESGEVFIRMVRQKFGRSKVNFALEVLEADQLDEDYQPQRPSLATSGSLELS